MTNPAAEASYGARLARIYDLAYAGMGKDYAAEAHQVRARGPCGQRSPIGERPRTMLDVACGTGTHLVEFARLGYRIAGTDLSQPMLDVARDRLGDDVPLVAASFERCPQPSPSWGRSIWSPACSRRSPARAAVGRCAGCWVIWPHWWRRAGRWSSSRGSLRRTGWSATSVTTRSPGATRP